MGAKIDREMVRLTDAERGQVKLQGAREMPEKEIREGPVDPAYARRQAAEWAREGHEAERARAAEKAREGERAPAPLLPAWRDPTGQGRDSLGRGLDERSVVAAVMGDDAVKREREALGHYLQGAYRDPAAAHAAIGEAVQRDGWHQAGKAIGHDPAQFGELREGYDARMRRQEEIVAAAWRKSRADPHVAGELDRFMLAASQRLGPEGEQAALQAARQKRERGLDLGR